MDSLYGMGVIMTDTSHANIHKLCTRLFYLTCHFTCPEVSSSKPGQVPLNMLNDRIHS